MAYQSQAQPAVSPYRSYGITDSEQPVFIWISTNHRGSPFPEGDVLLVYAKGSSPTTKGAKPTSLWHSHDFNPNSTTRIWVNADSNSQATVQWTWSIAEHLGAVVRAPVYAKYKCSACDYFKLDRDFAAPKPSGLHSATLVCWDCRNATMTRRHKSAPAALPTQPVFKGKGPAKK